LQIINLFEVCSISWFLYSTFFSISSIIFVCFIFTWFNYYSMYFIGRRDMKNKLRLAIIFIKKPIKLNNVLLLMFGFFIFLFWKNFEVEILQKTFPIFRFSFWISFYDGWKWISKSLQNIKERFPIKKWCHLRFQLAYSISK